MTRPLCLSTEFASVARDLLLQGRSATFTVMGISMLPSIRSGDAVTIVPRQSEPRVGDIVAICKNNRLLVHRVIAVDAHGGLVTAGDGLATADGYSTQDEVVGVVIAVNGERPPTGSVAGAPHALIGLRRLAARHPRAHRVFRSSRRRISRLKSAGEVRL